MAKTTTNYGLIKPERSDNYSVDVMGNNMDIIDAMVAPKTDVDAMKEKLDAFSVDADSNIVGNVNGKFTNTINVTPSTIQIFAKGTFVLLPYNNGAKYSGTIKLSGNRTDGSGDIVIYYLLSDGTYTSHTTPVNNDVAETFTIPNDCVYSAVYHPLSAKNQNYTTSIYLPIFS